MTRSWWESEDIIRRFRDWLTQTAEEMESSEEASAEDGLFSAAGDRRRDEEPCDEEPCDEEPCDEEPRDEEPRDEPARDEPAPALPDVGLLQLVEAFTAMRHELKLHTKGTRNLEASVQRSLEGLDSASRAFQSIQANEREAAERAALPMVEALIALDESLLRASQAFQATHRQMTRTAPARLQERLDQQFQQQAWWRRRLAQNWHAQVRQAAGEALAQSTAEEFASVMQGFELIQNRLARTLREQGIQRFDEAGEQVDPTRMTVVELVADAAAPPETVMEVVRPGYCWGERVVRFAEVRAVASLALQRDNAADPWDKREAGEPASPHIPR